MLCITRDPRFVLRWERAFGELSHLDNLTQQCKRLKVFLGWCVSKERPEEAGLFNSLPGFQILAL